MSKVAVVAVPRDVYRTFDYAIPEAMRERIDVGVRVRVTFNQDELTGFVVALQEGSSFKGKLLPIKELIDEESVLSESLLQLAQWIGEYYLSPLGMVLPAMIPSAVGSRRATRNYVHLTKSLEQTISAIDQFANAAPQQANLLKALLVKDEAPTAKDLLVEIGSTMSPLRSLEKKGFVGISKKSISHVVSSPFKEAAKEFALTEYQEIAIDRICNSLDTKSEAFLLHGVNASGKTEVYLRAVEHALSQNKQAIVMVPEISLTPQLMARFKERFGDRMAAFHSQLTEAQRANEWKRIDESEADVVVGVRSAIFAPLERLGLIVIDEEHEHTYKQEDPAPRYHARDVAFKRAEIENAVVVLGSGTPSLESSYRTESGLLTLLEMPHRAVRIEQPNIEIVDMIGNKNLLSQSLVDAILETTNAEEQVLLLLNLRGFSRALFCKRCREVQRCPRCKISLVYHMKEQRLFCHYCGGIYPVGNCRNCQSSELEYLGVGSEQAELTLKEAFPDLAIARMDSDSTKRGQHGEILEAFRKNEIQILLGTQMIGLGLDFPNVTLVGVLSADTMLNAPDFRAGERTFQLISQAIGRSGRGEAPGRVIIQTGQPDNYALVQAARGDYLSFYQEELDNRRLFEYPPLRHLVKITCESKREDLAKAKAEELHTLLSQQEIPNFDVIEPFMARPYQLRGEYRWRVVLSVGDPQNVQKFLQTALAQTKSSVNIKVDVDPQSLVF